jgi:hypothetical protein
MAPRKTAKPEDTNSQEERARQAATISAAEATAFATTTGAMLLGVLAGAADAAPPFEPEHQPVPQAPAADLEPLPAHEPITLPLDISTTDYQLPDLDLFPHPLQTTDAPAQDSFVPAALPTLSATPFDIAVTSEPAVSEDGMAPAVPAFDSGPSRASATSDSITATQDSVSHVAGSLVDITTTLTSTVTDLLSNTLETVSHVVTDLVGSLVQELDVVGDALQPVGNLVEGLTGGLGLAGETPPAFDSAPLVPTDSGAGSFAAAPLHLGFLGQSYANSADPDDGAFSALGVHSHM